MLCLDNTKSGLRERTTLLKIVFFLRNERFDSFDALSSFDTYLLVSLLNVENYKIKAVLNKFSSFTKYFVLFILQNDSQN